jgi:hypothetical protein
MTRRAPPHRFFRAAVCLSLGVLLGGCDTSAPVAATPPLAPGAESHPTGRRVDVLQGDALMMRMRISQAGVRVYDETGIRLGRLRLSSNGWVLQNRVGETLCEIPDETLGLVLRCGDLPPLEIEYDAPGEIGLQRNGEPVAFLRFQEGEGTLTLSGDANPWTASEGSMGIEIRTADGALWRTEPPGLTLPAALSLAIPPRMTEGSGAHTLERAAVAWIVNRAVLGASHDGSSSPVEGSTGTVEGSGTPADASGIIPE